jgi:hypothetical protein
MTSSPMPMDVVAAPVDETSAVALAPSADAPAVVLHTPVNLRSASLVVIATLACLVVLHWASAVFVPLVVGLMSSYALTPLSTAWSGSTFRARWPLRRCWPRSWAASAGPPIHSAPTRRR